MKMATIRSCHVSFRGTNATGTVVLRTFPPPLMGSVFQLSTVVSDPRELSPTTSELTKLQDKPSPDVKPDYQTLPSALNGK